MTGRSRTLLRADDLLALGDRAWRKELVEGEMVDMCPTGGPHGEIALTIGAVVHQFVRTHRLGRCFGAETGFLLSSDPDTVRAPDFAFVSTARLPGGRVPPGYFPGAPELAVEVLSPSEPPQEVKRKLREYFAAGSRLVWIVDPLAQTIRVYTAPSRPRTLTIDDELSGGEVLPGFRCPVREIFET